MKTAAYGFIAGFLATLIFHQLMFLILWAVGLTPVRPYAMTPVQPFGIPAVFSLAVWGGVWGILLALASSRFPSSSIGYWTAAGLFGAVFPSLVALLVVLPLKGKPVGAGWHASAWLTAFLVNAAWGLGTAAILGLLPSAKQKPRPAIGRP